QLYKRERESEVTQIFQIGRILKFWCRNNYKWKKISWVIESREKTDQEL
ncbi:unnamed protein product, partial [Allacma fusca]